MRIEDLLNGETIEYSYSVRVPTYVPVSKRVHKPVNLNAYRNMHHFQLDTQKKNFEAEVKKLLRDKPLADKVWIHYTIFAASKRRLDTMNVGAIVDKYFCDVLVSAGKLPDDDHAHVILSSFSFGGVSNADGHAIATVNILSKEKKPMRVLLDQEDIQAALEEHLKKLNLPGASGVELSVTDDGDIEAEVLMGEAKPKPKNRGGRPKGSKNKPKDDANVDETSGDSSEGSSDDADSGGSEPQTNSNGKGEKAAPKSSGNLFGDSDTKESSDSPTKTEDTEEESEIPPVKRGGLFDV